MTARIKRKKCAGPCGRNRTPAAYSSERARICNFCKKTTRRAGARKAHLNNSYELTVDEYDDIIRIQDGVCAICKGSRPYNLAVDHDHEVAELRGLRASIRGCLCKRCNKLLRDIRDEPDLLLAAVAYLLDPPARRVLNG